MPRCFGRLPHDPVRLAKAPQLAKYSSLAVANPPSRLDRSSVKAAFQMGDNDVDPDCTGAGYFNLAIMVAELMGYGLNVLPGSASKLYAQTVGIDPTNAAAIAASGGAMLMDLLTRQATQGASTGNDLLFGEPGVLPLTRNALANAMDRLGGAEIGVDFTDLDTQTLDDPAIVWDIQAGPYLPTEGHALVALDYTGLGDLDTVRLCSWGLDTYHATWRWIDSRSPERHGVCWRQLLPAGTEKNWAGVDWAGMAAEAAALAA